MKKTILFALVLALVLAMTGLVQAGAITVGPGGGYDFATIQAGIDAAVEGDTVLVAPGEYVITEPITFRGKAITVRSEAGPDQTTIRMQTPTDQKRGSVVIFENKETTDSVLDGFTITGGRGSWWPSESNWGGGGIVFDASSGIVRNCAVVENTAKNGGGVFAYSGSSPTLIDCTVAENLATDSAGVGGGVLCYINSSMTMTNCTIAENSAIDGGGVYGGSNSSMTMTDCTVRGNSATGSVPYVHGYGGGLYCWENSSMTITNCTITENSAGVGGGGLFCGQNSSVTMTDCIMTNNTAQGWVGGMQCLHSSVTLMNCVIARNTAGQACGGLLVEYTDSSLIIINCTIWGNSAGLDCGAVGCYFGASATVANSVIGGNTASGPEIFLQASPSILNVTHSNVAGGRTAAYIGGGTTLNWGEGNIDADPYFANPNQDDFHLKSQAGRWDPDSQTWVHDDVTSLCIDAGDPMSPIGWELFPNGGFVNMGAYGGTYKASKTYFGEPVCRTIVAGDINGDGQVNRADLEIMALHWTDEEPLPVP